jgi:hypothetical protein
MAPVNDQSRLSTSDPWASFRWQFPLVWIMWPGWLVAGPLLARFWLSVIGPHAAVGWLTFITYVLPVAILSYRVMWFRCPRCGERFFHGKTRNYLGFFSTFGETCKHCGLARYEIPELQSESTGGAQSHDWKSNA